MADGTLIFDTRCDTSGFNKAEKILAGSAKRIGDKIKAAFGSADSVKAAEKADKLRRKYDEATEAVERQKEELARLHDSIAKVRAEEERAAESKKSAASAAVAQQRTKISELSKRLSDLKANALTANERDSADLLPLERQAESVKAQIKELKALKKRYEASGARTSAMETEGLIAPLQKRFEALAKEIDKIVKSQEAADSRRSEKINNLGLQIDKAKTKLAELADAEKNAGKAYDRIKLGGGNKTSALADKIQTANNRLEQLSVKATDAKKQLDAMNSKKVSGLAGNINTASASLKSFAKRLKSTVKSALVFSVLYKALNALKSLMSSMLKNNTEFQASWAKIKGNLLTAFQPIYEACLPALLQLMTILEKVTASLASFTSALFGVSVSQMQANAKALNKQARATTSAGKAADKAARSLAGFDELNQLSDNVDSSSDSANSSVAPDFGESNIDSQLSDTWNKIATYALLLAGVGLIIFGIATADIKKIIEGVALAELGLSFGQANGVFDNQPAWMTQLITWGTILGGLGLMIFGAATGNYKSIATGIALMQLGIRYGTASAAFDAMPNWLKQVITWGSLLAGVGMLIAGICTLPGGLGMLVAGLGMIATGVHFGIATDSFDSALTLLENIWSDCKDFWDEYFAKFFTKDYWSTKWENVKSSCTEWWDGVKTWFSENVAPKFTKEYWIAKFESIRSSASEFKENTVRIFTNLFTGIKEKITGTWKSIKDWFAANVAPKFTKDYWINKFDAMKQGAKSTINGIIECFERGINNIITRINKLSWDIPEWVPGVGGKRFGFNISPVSLPRLATGTVVPANFGEFAAILGDNKREPEVVSPVSTIKQALREVMDELGGRPVQITVYTTLDGKIIGRSFVEYHNGVVAQTGVTPLKGV